MVSQSVRAAATYGANKYGGDGNGQWGAGAGPRGEHGGPDEGLGWGEGLQGGGCGGGGGGGGVRGGRGRGGWGSGGATPTVLMTQLFVETFIIASHLARVTLNSKASIYI